MKKNSIAIAFATVFAAAFASPAFSGDKANNQGQAGGAAGLVAAVVQIAANDTVDVKVVDSLNNLVALENVLNNSPILSENNTSVRVGDISLLEGTNVDVNALGITVDQINGVALATTGTVTDVIILI